MLSPYTVTIYTKQDSPYNVIPDAAIEIRERLANGTSGSLSTIYEDQEGLIPITQIGAKANSNGQFTFYAAAASYNALYESQTIPVDVGVTVDTLPSAMINNLSLPYVFDNVADYKAFATTFPVGKVIKLLDRGAEFTVISGTGTGNDRNIIANTNTTQSIVLIQKTTEDPRRWGAIFDNVSDIGPTLNFMLSQGIVPSIPKVQAVINTQVNILSESCIIFNGSRLKTTLDTGIMFNAAFGEDGFSLIGSALLLGTASGAGTAGQIGIKTNGNRRYRVENIISVQMGGHGFLIGDQLDTNRGEHGSWNNCIAYENQVGWEFEDGTSAEYTVLTGCSALENVTGVKNGAGNTNWTGGNIVDNGVGIDLYSGTNNNHGTFTGVNINHNTTTINATDVENGYTFTGCHFYGSAVNGRINLTNCKQFNFLGGTLACTVKVDKGSETKNGTNVFRNMYMNVPAWCGFSGDDLVNTVSKGHYSDDGLEAQFTIAPLPTRIVDDMGFQNGWSDAAGLMPLNYRVDEDNIVHINGAISGGSTTFANVLVSLGSTLSPPQNMEFILKEGSGATNAPAYIQIDTTGDILWLSGGNNEVCFNISYPLDA